MSFRAILVGFCSTMWCHSFPLPAEPNAFTSALWFLNQTRLLGGVAPPPPGPPTIAFVVAQAAPGVSATTALDAEMVTDWTLPAVTAPKENPQRAWKSCAARANPGRELSRAVNEPRLAPIAATTSMTM